MTSMSVAQIRNSLVYRLELSIRPLLALAVTVVQVKQSIIKSMFKPCKLFARLLAYLLHVVACGAILHVMGAAGVARSASPRHHGNTKVMGGMVFSTLPHPYNPIEVGASSREQSGSCTQHTHTKLMVDRKSSGKPNEKTK